MRFQECSSNLKEESKMNNRNVVSKNLASSCLALAGLISMAPGCGVGDHQKPDVQIQNPQGAPVSQRQQAEVLGCGDLLADPDPWSPAWTAAMSNGWAEGTWDSCAGGNRYQCVEYGQRYYNQRWGHAGWWPGVDFAWNMCDNRPDAEVRRYDLNDYSIPVWHGDLIVIRPYAGGGIGSAGHVAVINRDNGDGTVNVAEQNGGNGGWNNYPRAWALCGIWSTRNQGPY
jgi:hypothetical protein